MSTEEQKKHEYSREDLIKELQREGDRDFLLVVNNHKDENLVETYARCTNESDESLNYFAHAAYSTLRIAANRKGTDVEGIIKRIEMHDILASVIDEMPEEDAKNILEMIDKINKSKEK